MTTSIDVDYCILNLGIGLGIAADAMLATVARARSLNTMGDALRWGGAIGLTHWLFPMVGFLGAWYLVDHGLAASLVYGTGGAILGYYVIVILRARSSAAAEASESTQGDGSFWLAVWAVSIDALVTGPGKSVATAHWSTREVLWSFPFVGGVVFVMVLAAALPALRLNQMIRRGRMLSASQVGVFFVAATWIEISVFIWFCVLSFLEASDLAVVRSAQWLSTSAIAGSIVLILLALRWKQVVRAQFCAARSVVRTSPNLDRVDIAMAKGA